MRFLVTPWWCGDFLFSFLLKNDGLSAELLPYLSGVSPQDKKPCYQAIKRVRRALFGCD